MSKKIFKVEEDAMKTEEDCKERYLKVVLKKIVARGFESCAEEVCISKGFNNVKNGIRN